MKPSEMFRHWGQVRGSLLQMIDRFSQKELAFTPFKGSWSVGQIMLHIADCEDNWLHGVVRQEVEPWIFYDFKDFPTKKAILAVLEKAHHRTITLLNSLDEDDLDKVYKTSEGDSYTLRWIIWHVLEHEIHHRGELSLALGLLGHAGWGE
jgi:uncharacterized damage-inducible protein DinB